MFYQSPSYANSGRPNIPEGWDGLDESMPILTELVAKAPGSGYLATIFLNLVESSPRAAMLPFVIRAIEAWCSTYGIDPNFWSEKNIGSRVCNWLGRTLTADAAAPDVLAGRTENLLRYLDILVRSGVAQAREVEENITRMEPNRRAG